MNVPTNDADATRYARTVAAHDFSWADLAARAYSAQPDVVTAIRARPEATTTRRQARRFNDIAAILLAVLAPPLACILVILGVANVGSFTVFAVIAAVLILANVVYLLLGWRKSATRFHTGREGVYAWVSAAFGLVGAVITGVASASSEAGSLYWARPLAGLFIAMTVVNVAWALAVRRRLRTMRDDQPVETSYAVLNALKAMDARGRASAADDLRAAVSVLDERGITADGDRPELIRQLTRAS